jgi:hypothetical protein
MLGDTLPRHKLILLPKACYALPISASKVSFGNLLPAAETLVRNPFLIIQRKKRG